MKTIYEIYHHETNQHLTLDASYRTPHPMFKTWDTESPKAQAVCFYGDWYKKGFDENVNIIQIAVDKPFELELERVSDSDKDTGVYWIVNQKPLTDMEYLYQ